MASVTLDKINKLYDNGFHAVRDLDLEIADGEFLVLVGPSGCGKIDRTADGGRAGGHQHRRDEDRRPGGEHALAAGTATSPWCSSPTRCTRT